MAFPSVIVDDLYSRGTVCCPNKADLPPLINAKAVLPFPIVLERIEAVARGHLQIIKYRRTIQLGTFAKRRPLDIHPALDTTALKRCLGVCALEVLDSHELQQ